MPKRELVSLGALFFAAVGLLGIQIVQGPREKKSAAMRAANRDPFAAEMAQIEFGQIASSRASNPEVKQLARRIVPELQRALDEFKTAALPGVAVPVELSETDRAVRDRLKTAEGEGFDYEYVLQLTKALAGAAARYQKELQSGADPQLKAYAAAMLPKVQQQLRNARDVAGRIEKR